METKILEINLISAQGLKPPSAKILNLQTYAVVWVDSCTKLRTRIDRVGGENPTWNDKFLFKVTADFLSSETSRVSFEIYAVGCLRNNLIGTARLLISNVPSISRAKEGSTPSFVAIHIIRPCGKFEGVLNVGATVNQGSDFATMNKVPALDYRGLMGKNRRRRQETKKSEEDVQGENSLGGDSGDFSDSSSSSSSAASTTLKDWNGVRDFVASSELRSSNSAGLFCGLLKHKFSVLGTNFFSQP